MNDLLLSASNQNEPNEILIIVAALLGLLLVVILPIAYLIGVFLKYNPIDLSQQHRPYLSKLLFYQRLEPRGQKRFRKRVRRFINTKRFIARSKQLLVSPEMEVRIAAAAVELTFGFKKFSFEQFSKILIYQDDYYSKITKRYHRGEVNPRGFIVLSWKAFEAGYDDPKDGINLGIHEMAHALKLENRIVNADHSFIEDLDSLALEMAHDKLQQGHSPLEGFFRNYAKANIHEFFAVACENFLERPEAFQKADPELYRLMVKILRQDPLSYSTHFKAQRPEEPTKTWQNSGPIERY